LKQFPLFMCLVFFAFLVSNKNKKRSGVVVVTAVVTEL